MRDMLCDTLQVWNYLEPTGSVANDCDLLASGIEGWIPVGGMPQMSFVAIKSWIVWQLPGIETSYGCDYKVEVFLF